MQTVATTASSYPRLYEVEFMLNCAQYRLISFNNDKNEKPFLTD